MTDPKSIYLGVGFPVFLSLMIMLILKCGRVKQPVIAVNPSPTMLAKTQDIILQV